MTPATRVFERAGLGFAPFRLVAVEIRRGPIMLPGGLMVGAPGQPMGTCDYCGTGIAECCLIRDASGKTFIVGNECVRKTGDAGLRKAQNKALVAKRHESEDARIADGAAWIEANASALDAVPTTRGTMLSRVRWFMSNAGRAGKLRAIREAHAALAQKENDHA